jgi:hypothetical protein
VAIISAALTRNIPPKWLAAFRFHLRSGPADVTQVAVSEHRQLVARADPSPPFRYDPACSDEHSMGARTQGLKLSCGGGGGAEIRGRGASAVRDEVKVLLSLGEMSPPCRNRIAMPLDLTLG